MSKDFPPGATVIFGASGGIGQGVALAFAAAGSNLALVFRSKQDIAELTASKAIALGRNATVHKADVRDASQIDNVIAQTIAAHDRIHTLVWAAGPLVDQKAIADWDGEQFRMAMEVEAFGFYNAARAIIPHMRESGGGSFVHLGSAGHDRFPRLDGLSVVPKASNEALIKGIAKEEGVHNIRANSVLVGVIEAGMFLELTKQGQLDQKWVDETLKLLALKRWGKPEDIGNATVFLASNRANYITGQTISVSGGFGV